MVGKLFFFILLICSSSNAGEFYLEAEGGIAAHTSVGFRSGVSFGVEWEPITLVAEIQYFRFTTTAFGNEFELHAFPIGFGIRVPVFDKWRISSAYYYDNGIYKNLTIIPMNYSIVYESNNTWRAGVGYEFSEQWWLNVYYENTFSNRYKQKSPVAITGDLTASAEIKAVALTVSYTF